MLILPFALVVGALVGAATGGSLRALGRVQLRRGWIVVAAIGAQAALSLPGLRAWPSGLRFAVIVVSYAVVGWWLFDNARSTSGVTRTGLGLVTLGWGVNLLAILPNGGMPVSRAAMRAAGFAPDASVVHGHLSKHVVANQGTYLRFLGDVIPVSFFRAVVSPGDIVMAIGIITFVAAAMKIAPESADAAAAPGEAVRSNASPTPATSPGAQSRPVPEAGLS